MAITVNCKHVWDSISDYLDRTLTPESRAEVERHLAICEVCSAVLDSTRNILILVADEKVYELPVGYSERLHARLEEEIAKVS